MSNFPEEKLIHTKELPIVSFCAYCDKPIYIGDEYKEVEYYDSESTSKKHLVKGYAHLHCAEEKEREVEELKVTEKKKDQKLLAFAVVSGFICALALMLILIFWNATHLAFSIIVPWVIGYALTSEIFVLFSDNPIGQKYQLIGLKLLKTPIWIHSLDSDSSLFVIVKIFLYVLLVPMAYLAVVILFLLSLLISMIAFPIILLKKK